MPLQDRLFDKSYCLMMDYLKSDHSGQLTIIFPHMIKGIKRLYESGDKFNNVLEASRICLTCADELIELLEFDSDIMNERVPGRCNMCNTDHVMPENIADEAIEALKLTKWWKEYSDFVCCFKCCNFLMKYDDIKKILDIRQLEYTISADLPDSKINHGDDSDADSEIACSTDTETIMEQPLSTDETPAVTETEATKLSLSPEVTHSGSSILPELLQLRRRSGPSDSRDFAPREDRAEACKQSPRGTGPRRGGFSGHRRLFGRLAFRSRPTHRDQKQRSSNKNQEPAEIDNNGYETWGDCGDNEQYTGSLSDTKVFTPSGGPQSDLSADYAQRNPNSSIGSAFEQLTKPDIYNHSTATTTGGYGTNAYNSMQSNHNQQPSNNYGYNQNQQSQGTQSGNVQHTQMTVSSQPSNNSSDYMSSNQYHTNHSGFPSQQNPYQNQSVYGNAIGLNSTGELYSSNINTPSSAAGNGFSNVLQNIPLVGSYIQPAFDQQQLYFSFGDMELVQPLGYQSPTSLDAGVRNDETSVSNLASVAYPTMAADSRVARTVKNSNPVQSQQTGPSQQPMNLPRFAYFYNTTPYQSAGQQANQTGANSDIASSMYNKSHVTLNKVNSYDKQSVHSGTPPPFNLAGSQADSQTQAYQQHLYLQPMAPQIATTEEETTIQKILIHSVEDLPDNSSGDESEQAPTVKRTRRNTIVARLSVGQDINGNQFDVDDKFTTLKKRREKKRSDDLEELPENIKADVEKEVTRPTQEEVNKFKLKPSCVLLRRLVFIVVPLWNDTNIETKYIS